VIELSRADLTAAVFESTGAARAGAIAQTAIMAAAPTAVAGFMNRTSISSGVYRYMG
jgi:hypothetical protein